jgi:hypothetical protein
MYKIELNIFSLLFIVVMELSYDVRNMEEQTLMELDIDAIKRLGKDNVPEYVWLRKSQFLKEAAESGNLTGVIYIIENNHEIEGAEYTSALQLAAENGHLDIVKYMAERAVEHDVDLRINFQPLLVSAANGHLPIVRYLVEEHNADIHVFNNLILILSASDGHIHVVRYLVGRGADINVDNGFVFTIAAQNGYLDIMKFLIGEGINIKKNHYNEALQWAAENGHLPIVKFLIEECEADIHANNDGALRLSAEHGNSDIVEYLVDRYTDNNITGIMNDSGYIYKLEQ